MSHRALEKCRGDAMFFVDEQKPENCRVNFDAKTYDRNEMRVMLDRYLRLLEAAAREPELPIGRLLRDDRRQATAMDVRKLRGAFLRRSLQVFTPHRRC